MTPADGRFPPDVARLLLDAGWFPGRDVSAEVDAWLIRDAGKLEGLTLSPAARTFLVEFGGLTVPQFGPRGGLGGFASSYLPQPDAAPLGRSAAFQEWYDVAVFPVGWNDDDAELAIDDRGRLFFLHWSDEFLVGDSPDAGLIALIRGHEWPSVDPARL